MNDNHIFPWSFARGFQTQFTFRQRDGHMHELAGGREIKVIAAAVVVDK